MARKTDVYANKFFGTVLESGPNTLTFAEIPTNVDVFAKKAWVLHKLEWYLDADDRSLLLASQDAIRMALTSSDRISALGLDNPAVIDLLELNVIVYSAVACNNYEQPLIRDFNNMPGGGLIITPRPLFVAVQGVSVASPVQAFVRGYFTAVDLNADEYLELVDFYRIVS